MLTRRCVLKFGAVAAFSLATAVIAGPRSQAADPPLEVVASFSILGDMVKTVGGDRVQVITLVGPDGDAHVFEPTPADARAIADAKVVFINGLGLEQGRMPRLIEASGYKGPVRVTSKGIEPLRMEEEEDEHAEGRSQQARTRAREAAHGR